MQRFVNAVYGGDCHPGVVIGLLDIVERVFARKLGLCRHGYLENNNGDSGCQVPWRSCDGGFICGGRGAAVL